MGTIRRVTVRAGLLSAMTATTVLFAVAGGAVAAAAAPAGTSSACPSHNKIGNTLTASNVAATFSTTGLTTTYTFTSLQNENPQDGVPGLIKYCVYPSTRPTTVTATATGANGDPWNARTGAHSFSFVRPKGNPSNIPLDGKTTVMGNATWTTVPTDQAILLHINDSAACKSLYGAHTSGTCFVKPSQGPICNSGDAGPGIAYNAMPVGVVDCPKPSLGFEATQTSEFGDEVGLAGTARQLVSLRVLFASFACQSGHWNTGDCSTTPGATFTHPITGNIYAVADCGGTPCPGTKLATVTQTFTIPYRPSADPINCPNATNQWFNPVAGICQNSISTVLTFNFAAGVTLPDQVIWTVAFNTTDYGSPNIGTQPCNSGPGGCPYDSLNVGAQTFAGAPYAGVDVDPNGAFLSSTSAAAYCDNGAGGTGTLRLDTQATDCWLGLTPLGEITTTT